MALVPPTCDTPDIHYVLRLSVYPEWSKLSAVTYRLSGSVPSPSSNLFSPRPLRRPTDAWDVLQSLSFGIDVLANKWLS